MPQIVVSKSKYYNLIIVLKDLTTVITCLSKAIHVGISGTSPLGNKEGYLSDKHPSMLGLTLSTKPGTPGAI